MNGALTWPAMHTGDPALVARTSHRNAARIKRVDQASFRREEELLLLGAAAASWANAERRLRELLDLTPDWDSYGGQGPARELVAYAAAELASLKALQLPPPVVSPSGDGKILASWCGKGIEVELWFEAPYQEVLIIEDSTSSQESYEGSDPMLFRTSLALRKIGTGM